jgi:hypothetical protein
MTRRVLVAALAASLALPAAGSAQLTPRFDDAIQPRLKITPFIGYLAGITRGEDWVFQDQASVVTVQSEVQVGGGTGGGLHVESRIWGDFGLSGLVGFASRGQTVFIIEETNEAWAVDGARVFFVRAGPVYHIPWEDSDFVMRRLGASVFAGLTAMHERSRNTLGTGDIMGNGTHFGLNLGMSAELPFAADRFAVQLGAENNIMFWNRTHLARLPYEYFGQPGQSPNQTTVTTNASNAWLLRAGLSYRMP